MTFFQQNSKCNRPWHIICDFDGTISRKDTTDTLLKNFAHPDWERIEQQWEQGKIGSKQCMQQQIALLDMTEQQLLHCLDQIEIDPSFIKLVRLLERHHIKLSVVSDGLDRVIHYILKKHQLEHLPVIANRLDHPDEKSWQLSFPYSDQLCSSQSGTCKCKVAKQNINERIILIGDGRSDFCLAERADFVFAKKSLIQYCVDKHVQHQAFEQFSQLLEPLYSMITDQAQEIENTVLWVNS